MQDQEKYLTAEISAIQKELDEFKLQLGDISRKESELLNKKENFEINNRKKKKNQKDKDELDKKQNTIKELQM